MNEQGGKVGWRLLRGKLEILDDCYAFRYVEQLDNRCEAYVFFLSTATYSRNVAFWHTDYYTPEDAVLAAKSWAMNRGPLKRLPSGDFRYQLAAGKYTEPEPTVFRAATSYGIASG